ncbi:MAG: hypothetical protein WC961_07250 [Anaerovoracaceae bacterium]
MTIKYKNFTLTPGNGETTFDLTKTVEVIARTQTLSEKHNVPLGEKTGSTNEIIIGYDFQLETALKQIVLSSLSDKEDIVSLHEFIAAYAKEKEELQQTIKKALSV